VGSSRFWLRGSAVSVYELASLQSLNVKLWIRIAPTIVDGHVVGLVASLANARSGGLQEAFHDAIFDVLMRDTVGS